MRFRAAAAFLFLVAGVVAVPIASRLGLGSVLGYLVATLRDRGEAEDVLQEVFVNAHAAILASSMFGTMSGSTVANIVGTGTFGKGLVQLQFSMKNADIFSFRFE